MAYGHDEIIKAQYQQLENERVRALADYEYGRVAEDEYSVMTAADRILAIDQKKASLERVAQVYLSQQSQAQQGNRYGLSQDEVDVAKASGISDEQYVRNKQRMHAMKDQGYWSQGRVFK